MHIENKNNCTGCGTCYNICPQDAIKIKNDMYGFYKPFIDKNKCINCGLCEKKCPLDSYKTYNFELPKAFAFQNNDKETLYKCASGGAFAYFAKYIIEHGGCVYGVIYDENMKVCHSRANNLNDLQKMYSSKYVQSDTQYCYRHSKEDLDRGLLVLYSGTPCQIAGLKSYLQKDYDNLYTIDLVCHGVPSPLVFEKYKQEFMMKLPKAEKLLNINFRSKVEGWRTELVTTTTTTTTITNTHAKNDDFMRAFLSNLSINTSCLNCQFNKLPRVADLSIADFWGVDEYDKSINDDRGLSLILVNTKQGQKLYNINKSECLLKEIPLEFAIKHNKNICGSSKPHKNRIPFLKAITKKSLNVCITKYDKKAFYRVLFDLLPQFAKNYIKIKILKRNKC